MQTISLIIGPKTMFRLKVSIGKGFWFFTNYILPLVGILFLVCSLHFKGCWQKTFFLPDVKKVTRARAVRENS